MKDDYDLTEEEVAKLGGVRYWPACWQAFRRSEESKTRMDCGSKTTYDPKTNALTYTCRCGSTFAREEGYLIEETRAWVIEHTPHMSGR